MHADMRRSYAFLVFYGTAIVDRIHRLRVQLRANRSALRAYLPRFGNIAFKLHDFRCAMTMLAFEMPFPLPYFAADAQHATARGPIMSWHDGAIRL